MYIIGRSTDDKKESNSKNKTEEENITEEFSCVYQTYQCRPGKLAKIQIPADAEKQDLIAIQEVLKIVFKGRFDFAES